MEKTYCIECGNEIPENAKYCPTCGTSQNDTVNHLSKKERLSFLLQFKILKSFAKESDKTYYDEFIEIVKNGYSSEYHRLFSFVPFEEISVDECNEVYDIFDMYSGIISSYKALKQSGEIKDLDESKITFSGFDGNNEQKQLSYAKYVLSKPDTYENLKDFVNGDLNNHCSILPKYKAMLKKWSEKKHKNLTEEEIVELLNTY